MSWSHYAQVDRLAIDSNLLYTAAPTRILADNVLEEGRGLSGGQRRSEE